MAAPVLTYARTKTVLWAIFGPVFPIFCGSMFFLPALGASEGVTAMVIVMLLFGWLVVAARFTAVPVEVSLSSSGLRVRALRGWHPYRELDIGVGWAGVRSALFGQNQDSAPKAWLLVQLREPAVAFSLAGEIEAIRSLHESLQNAIPKPDEQARRHLAGIATGAGFWKSHAATLITILFGAMWAVITGAGVMHLLGTANPFPWLVWLVLTFLCVCWLLVYRSARKGS